MMPKKNGKLPGRQFLQSQLMKAGFSGEDARRAVSVLVRAMGEAVAMDGFELRGFATLRLEQGARMVKRNPRTGQVLRDDDGQPIYYSRRRVRLKLSKGVV